MRRLRYMVSIAVLLACGDDGSTTLGGAGSPSTGGSNVTGTGAAGAAGGMGGAGTGATGGGGSAEGGTGGTGATGGGTGGSGGPEGGSGGEGVGGFAPGCDGDGDDSPRQGPNCCGNPDPCDCDDNDANVFPDQMLFFGTPRPFENDPILKWDYDCDGVATKQYPPDTDGCGILACQNPIGFQGNNGDYFCGAPGTKIECDALSCTTEGAQVLGCH